MAGGVTLAPDGGREHVLVALADDATLDGRPLARGTAAFVPALGDTVRITGSAAALLHPGPGPSPCLAMG